MKREKISEAMGNISSRHIKEAAEFKAEEKPLRSKNVWVKWVSIAACFCLIIVAAFAVIPMLNNGDGDEIVDNVLPTDIDKIIWSSHLGSDSDSDEGYMDWNGFSVDTSLYNALQNYSNEYIAVIMTRANGQKIEETEYNEILAKTINRDYKNGSLYIFVTRDQFLDWNLENKGDYIFYLASRSAYEGSVTEAPTDEIEDFVTGFAYEKFKFSNNDGNVVKSDAEVISLMNALINQWKYTYDSIEITLYTHVPEEELEALNYSGIMQLKYPDRTVIQVKYVNINMEALKELSKRSDISYIHISEPSTAIEEEPAVDG
ncbi:MAG: hypothetical protein IJZ93_06755 [Clostridia bacterium]|nr:hypothetical protein [Clostridia bacterium]